MEIFSGNSGVYMTPSEKRKAAERIRKGGVIADAIRKNASEHHAVVEIPEAEKILEERLEAISVVPQKTEENFSSSVRKESLFFALWRLISRFFLRLFRATKQ